MQTYRSDAKVAQPLTLRKGTGAQRGKTASETASKNGEAQRAKSMHMRAQKLWLLGRECLLPRSTARKRNPQDDLRFATFDRAHIDRTRSATGRLLGWAPRTESHARREAKPQKSEAARGARVWRYGVRAR